ncbi:MAG: hypothetical protein P8M17_01035 [Saprospiraceae bacterium]|jgi:hypothetical protein|nr:hypothetical protein [Saprospiraceae bacterium]MDG2417544.1 hypothetical protein [Saprospiraceae bacterium]
MKSKIAKKTPLKSDSSLASTVFSILDSRIQFLEYQINLQFTLQNKSAKNQLTAYEKLMVFYEKTSDALKLLQILKEWVRADNAFIIFNLLQNDEYLNYSETQLEKKIRI